ncbi:putative periplasmic serine endoprotease DegP-like precursor [Thalassoglobus polymorphus]|uniref:Putative periplasmic serine endoprotease DegP-like n=2 Tax=Thalassoglobus polymorphus TaxID=2527994 RepID=A0A517QRJ9_9PLAN|nr:putative periplasmic serine endoprotease DegP-like precursor [Thalassoglobus polymorphus]
MMTMPILQPFSWSQRSLGSKTLLLIMMFVFANSARIEAQENLRARQLQQLEFSMQANAELGQKSFVAIAVSQTELQQTDPATVFENLLNPESGQLPASVGGGVVVDVQGASIKVLTTAHLLDHFLQTPEGSPASKIYVRFGTQETAIARVIASDPRSDLAVLQVERTRFQKGTVEIVAVRFPKNFNPRKGTFFSAIGTPWSLAKDGSSSIQLGLISNLSRRQSQDNSTPVVERTLHDLGTLLELSHLDPQTSSGTLLLNLNGEFCGLVTSIATPDDQRVTSSYAIPMTPGIVRIVNELKQGYEVNYGFLGISPETSRPDELQGLDLKHEADTAVIVSRVARNSPAEKSGIQREDFILQVNGTPIGTNSDLVREIGLVAPGESAEIVLYRINEGEKRISVRLGKWPIYDDSKLVATQQEFPAWRGLEVDYPTGRRRYLRDRFLSEFPNGVVVSHVEPESLAAQAGLQVGQFIQSVASQMISSPEEFHAVMKEQNGEVSVSLASGLEIIIEAP